jgi:hypothetical protein
MGALENLHGSNRGVAKTYRLGDCMKVKNERNYSLRRRTRWRGKTQHKRIWERNKNGDLNVSLVIMST